MVGKGILENRDESGDTASPSAEARRLCRDRAPAIGHVALTPWPRTLAFVFLACVVVPLHEVLAGRSSWSAVVMGSALLLVFPFLSRSVLGLAFRRPERVDGSVALPCLDLAACIFAIQVTGAAESWLFFLPLLIVADQTHTGARRTLLFAHLSPTAYLGLVLWSAGWHGGTGLWTAEGAKLLGLWAGGLYLFLSARAHERGRERLLGTVRRATRALESFERRSRRMAASERELRALVNRDPLTGLLNRRGILEVMERGLGRARRRRAPFSVVLADVDNFKGVNDKRGHTAGDQVLRSVAQHILDTVRAFDAVGRLGGDEFLIVLPDCDVSGAVAIAERIRAGMESGGVPLPSGEGVEVELSLGVTTAASRWFPALEDLIDTADTALYEAKRKGRNRVEVSRVEGGRVLEA